jgi:hypothetical protein
MKEKVIPKLKQKNSHLMTDFLMLTEIAMERAKMIYSQIVTLIMKLI